MKLWGYLIKKKLSYSCYVKTRNAFFSGQLRSKETSLDSLSSGSVAELQGQTDFMLARAAT